MTAFYWPLDAGDEAEWEVEPELLAPEFEGYSDEGVPLYGEPGVELRVFALDIDGGRELNDFERIDWLDVHGARAVEHALDLALDEAVSAAERQMEGP